MMERMSGPLTMAAMGRLAGLMPDGYRMVSTRPWVLIEAACDELEKLRRAMARRTVKAEKK